MTDSTRHCLLDFECMLCHTRFTRPLARPDSGPTLLCPTCSSPEKLAGDKLGAVVAAATVLGRFRETRADSEPVQ